MRGSRELWRKCSRDNHVRIMGMDNLKGQVWECKEKNAHLLGSQLHFTSSAYLWNVEIVQTKHRDWNVTKFHIISGPMSKRITICFRWFGKFLQQKFVFLQKWRQEIGREWIFVNFHEISHRERKVYDVKSSFGVSLSSFSCHFR